MDGAHERFIVEVLEPRGPGSFFRWAPLRLTSENRRRSGQQPGVGNQSGQQHVVHQHGGRTIARQEQEGLGSVLAEDLRDILIPIPTASAQQLNCRAARHRGDGLAAEIGEGLMSLSPWRRLRSGSQPGNAARREIVRAQRPGHPDFDVAIWHGDGSWPDVSATVAETEESFPVCSPTLFERRPRIKSKRRSTTLSSGTPRAFLRDEWPFRRVNSHSCGFEIPEATRHFNRACPQRRCDLPVPVLVERCFGAHRRDAQDQVAA